MTWDAGPWLVMLRGGCDAVLSGLLGGTGSRFRGGSRSWRRRSWEVVPLSVEFEVAVPRLMPAGW